MPIDIDALYRELADDLERAKQALREPEASADDLGDSDEALGEEKEEEEEDEPSWSALPSFGDWRALGAGGPGARRDQQFLNVKSIASVTLRFGVDDDDDDENAGGDGWRGRRLLAKYLDYCAQLDLTPNTGVTRALRGDPRSVASEGGTFAAAHFGLMDGGVVPVARLLQHHLHSLTLVDLSDNGLSDRGALTLLFCLGREHLDLRAVNLSGNVQVSGKSLKPLLAFVRQKPKLRELGVDGTGLSSEEQQVIHLEILVASPIRRGNGGGGSGLLLLQERRRRRSSAAPSTLAGGGEASGSDAWPLLLKESPTRSGVERLARRFRLGEEQGKAEEFRGASRGAIGADGEPRLRPPEWPPLRSRSPRQRTGGEKASEFLQPLPGKELEPEPESESVQAREPNEVLNSWEARGELDLLGAICRRWEAESLRVAGLLLKAEERAAAQAAQRRLQERVEAWLRFVSLLRQVDRGLTPEQELDLTVRRELPVRRLAIDAERSRIRWLLDRTRLASGRDERRPKRIYLREQAAQRLDMLRAEAERLQRNLALLSEATAHSSIAGASLRSTAWAQRIGEVLEIKPDGMQRAQLQELTSRLSALLSQGQRMADAGKEVDRDLLSSARLRLEELLELVASKQRLRRRTSAICARFRKSSHAVALLQSEVTEKASLVASSLARTLADFADWRSSGLPLEALAGTVDRLQSLLDAANIRFSSEVDGELLSMAESLLSDMAEYLAKVEKRQQRLLSLELAAAETLTALPVGEQDEAGRAKLQRMLDTLAPDEEELEEEFRVHKCRSELMQQRKSLARIKDDLDGGLRALQRGSDFFGLSKRDKKLRTSIGAVLPLQRSLQRLLDPEAAAPPGPPPPPPWPPEAVGEGEVEAIGIIDTLRSVSERLKKYGYMEKACTGIPFVKDENARLTLEDVVFRMAKLEFVDKAVVERIYGLLEPFTFANFRRLLASAAVRGATEEGGEEAEEDDGAGESDGGVAGDVRVAAAGGAAAVRGAVGVESDSGAAAASGEGRPEKQDETRDEEKDAEEEEN